MGVEIGMATALLMEISRDEQERARFRSRRMFETDMTSNLLTAEARGEAIGERRGRIEGERRGRIEGERRGRIEGKLEIARNMKAKNIDVSYIIEITGLTPDEIQRL